MYLTKHNALTLIGLSLLAGQLVNGQTSNGACVQSCITAHPISSTCNGDETGQALDQCTCASFYPGNALITCVQACPTDQQTQYAEHLPALCRSTLFPNLSLSSTAAGTATSSSSPQTTEQSTATATTSGAESTASSSTSASSTATASGSGAGANVFDASFRGWTATFITGITAWFWYL